MTRLQPRLFRVGGVHDLVRVAVPLRPAQVHAHEHLREVRGVHATGAGADRDDRVALVVLAREQGAHLELVERLVDRDQLLLGLFEGVSVVLLGGELDHDLEVLDARGELADASTLGLRVGEGRGDLLRVVDVVPQVLGRCLLLEVGDLGVERLDVGHLLDRRQGRAELGDLYGEVDGSHEARVYGRSLDRADGIGPSRGSPGAFRALPVSFSGLQRPTRRARQHAPAAGHPRARCRGRAPPRPATSPDRRSPSRRIRRAR